MTGSKLIGLEMSEHINLYVRKIYITCQQSCGACVFVIQSLLHIIIYCYYVGSSAGIFEQSMVARNRVGIGLSFRPARLHRLTESIPWNRFLGSLKV
jgi:hypothetical protein